MDPALFSFPCSDFEQRKEQEDEERDVTQGLKKLRQTSTEIILVVSPFMPQLYSEIFHWTNALSICNSKKKMIGTMGWAYEEQRIFDYNNNKCFIAANGTKMTRACIKCCPYILCCCSCILCVRRFPHALIQDCTEIIVLNK